MHRSNLHIQWCLTIYHHILADLALCRYQTELGKNLRMAVTVPWRAKLPTPPMTHLRACGLSSDPLQVCFWESSGLAFMRACVVAPDVFVIQAV
jgi:hypothetical protein